MLSKKRTKSELLRKYEILTAEMKKRGLKVGENTPLDAALGVALFKRAMLGIDVTHLDDVVVVPDYITIGGEFVKSPKNVKDLDLVMRQDEGDRDEGTELKISRLVKKQTGKECRFVYSKSGPHSNYIPAFDLVLRAKDDTRRVKVKEDYGTGMEKAKKEGTGEPLPALEDYENLLHHIHTDDKGEEEIHHCLILDHIANMFEQVHLWIKDGKIYLDGKEIKEGVFHVVKGLESTQEVVWTDEEAEENEITAKKMKIGMTLKEKAKEW